MACYLLSQQHEGTDKRRWGRENISEQTIVVMEKNKGIYLHTAQG